MPGANAPASSRAPTSTPAPTSASASYINTTPQSHSYQNPSWTPSRPAAPERPVTNAPATAPRAPTTPVSTGSSYVNAGGSAPTWSNPSWRRPSTPAREMPGTNAPASSRRPSAETAPPTTGSSYINADRETPTYTHAGWEASGEEATGSPDWGELKNPVNLLGPLQDEDAVKQPAIQVGWGNVSGMTHLPDTTSGMGHTAAGSASHNSYLYQSHDGSTGTHAQGNSASTSITYSPGMFGFTGGLEASSSTEITVVADSEEEAAARTAELQEGQFLNFSQAGDSISTTHTNGWQGGFSLGVPKLPTGVENGPDALIPTASIGFGHAYEDTYGMERTSDDEVVVSASASSTGSVNGGLSVADFGATAGRSSTHTVTAETVINESELTPESAAEVQRSLELGVLPGALSVDSEAGIQLAADLEANQARIAELHRDLLESQSIGQSSYGHAASYLDFNSSSIQTEIDALERQIIHDQRALNGEFIGLHGAGTEVLPGVTVQLESTATDVTNTLTANTPLFDLPLSSIGNGTLHQQEFVDGQVVTTQGTDAHNDTLLGPEREAQGLFTSDGDMVFISTVEGSNRSADAANIVGLAGPDATEALTAPTYQHFDSITTTSLITNDQVRDIGAGQIATTAEDGYAGATSNIGDVLRADLSLNGGGDYSNNGDLANYNQIQQETRGIDGVNRIPPAELAALFDTVEGPQDLQRFEESHPEMSAGLQQAYVLSAVTTGSIQSPEELVGMVTMIGDDQIMAETMARAFTLYSTGGGENATAMLGAIHGMAEGNPVLQSALEQQATVTLEG